MLSWKAFLIGLPLGLFVVSILLTAYVVRKPVSRTSKAFESKPSDISPVSTPLPSLAPSPHPHAPPTATPAAMPENITGDINGDDVVNSLDLSALLATWGEADEASDLNGDGTVNTLDLTILQRELAKQE